MNQQLKTLRPLAARVWSGKTAKKTNGRAFWTGSSDDNPLECLTEQRLQRHISGGPGRGCGWIEPGASTTRGLTFDLDSHNGETDWAGMARAADTIIGVAQEYGLRLTPFSSSGGRGIHLYAIWDEPQDAYSARCLAREVLGAAGFTDKAGGGGVAAGFVEVFPKQDSVPEDGSGNFFILPLHAKSVPLAPDLSLLPQDAAVAWQPSDPVPLRTKPTPEPVERGETPAELTELASALYHIAEQAGAEIPREDWRNLLFGLHHETEGSDEGLALANEFSSLCREYDADEVLKVWESSRDKDTSITGATILFKARELGWGTASADDFDDVTDDEVPVAIPKATKLFAKFTPIHASLFAAQAEGPYLVKGVLPAASRSATLAVMYGASGSGKSFIATDLACCIALGIPWRNHRVTKGRVVYVCAEGAGGYRKRLQAYAQRHKIPLDQLDVFVIPAAPNLLEADDVSALIRAIHEIGPVVLVVIDTLAQTTAGGNENSGEDMGKAIGHCRTISEVLHCTVLLVHHSGKDDTKGARGHSSLKAAADTELEVVRTDDRRAMRVSKQKDGEDGLDMGFTLGTETLGLDSDGDPITSCVVEHNDDTVAEVRAAKNDRAGPVENTLLNVLDSGSGLTDDPCMLREDLLEQTKERLEWDGTKRDQRRGRAVKALKNLLKKGTLVDQNGKIQRGREI